MDEFDIVDLVTDIVKAAETGLLICKDRSQNNESLNHIVINHLELQEFDFYNILPVNINIYIRTDDKGRIDRKLMKNVKRAIRQQIDNIQPVKGVYRGVNNITSGRIQGKEGFDSYCIRIEIETDN